MSVGGRAGSSRAKAAGPISFRFTVRDTGIGIPLDKQSAIFDAFTQADNSTTREFGGIGLGLTIAPQLAALMGGAISLESRCCSRKGRK